jgi:arsenate reductase (thioredoxin)
MADGFARRSGSDVMEVESAGFAPAPIIQPMTKQVMQAKNIRIDDQYPKDLGCIDIRSFHLIVNMSGTKLPAFLQIEVRDWEIEDPIGRNEEFFIQVRDQIEDRVMRLILEFRREARRFEATSPLRGLFRNWRIT